ncbi:hypothetical protein EC973_009273 [Apophysomyces ossiformis]|uniref:CTLH domain-containing protein n=1 Tax=Apophysomyces ossiformis TaxID=679940 RepID=A0A8H7C0E7_9FUNG|nr:hypothetical protein EC973_009273 [Apophysomyces ossiformis]
METTLQDLGYQEAAQVLQRDSHVSVESPTVTQFREAVMNGDWDTTESVLPALCNSHPGDLAQAAFLVRQQKFLELLESRKTMKALQVLRNELTPMELNVERLHELSSLILCSSVEDIKSRAQWHGTDGFSREHLLSQLQRYIDPSIMIPKERLLTLLNQAFDWQLRGCLYHDSKNADFSLFSEHMCDETQFPSATVHILEGHTDEVWHISFAHCGLYLASVSNDKTCIIWDMQTYEKIHILEGASESNSFSAWSPDDSKLLVCGDNHIRLWSSITGELLHTFAMHTDQVTSCAWLPDGNKFISGGCDKRLVMWGVDGAVLTEMETQRVLEARLTSDGSRLVTIDFSRTIGKKHIVVYNVVGLKLEEVRRIPVQDTITSLTLTKDGRYALLNVQEVQELHLWDLETQSIVRKYCGHTQGNYIIRSTFGGDDESFVLSGSEDDCVYVWSREHGVVLEVLEGHTKTVNCISWSPINPMMFASASDDATIRM